MRSDLVVLLPPVLQKHLRLEQRETLRRVRSQLDTSQQRLARVDTLQSRVGGLQEDLLTVASPGTRTRLLNATRRPFPGRAQVFIDSETGHALLFARDLPVLSPDSVYQLWTIEGETPESAGTFTPVRTDGPAWKSPAPGSFFGPTPSP